MLICCCPRFGCILPLSPPPPFAPAHSPCLFPHTLKPIFILRRLPSTLLLRCRNVRLRPPTVLFLTTLLLSHNLLHFPLLFLLPLYLFPYVFPLSLYLSISSISNLRSQFTDSLLKAVPLPSPSPCLYIPALRVNLCPRPRPLPAPTVLTPPFSSPFARNTESGCTFTVIPSLFPSMPLAALCSAPTSFCLLKSSTSSATHNTDRFPHSATSSFSSLRFLGLVLPIPDSLSVFLDHVFGAPLSSFCTTMSSSDIPTRLELSGTSLSY